MKSFEFLLPKRTEKPRNQGITMVLDKGLGVANAKSLMEISGEYVDFLKLGWGTAIVHDKEIIKEKVAMYKSFNIRPFPGGTLFELAYLNNKFEEYLEEAKDIGFETLEISNGSTDIPLEEKLKCITLAKEKGFYVLSEVGKKDPDLDAELSVEERIELINKELAAGSDKVIIEARESGKNIGIFDKNGNAKQNEINKIIEEIATENLIWEAPNKNQQVFFVLNINPDVNLGNISSEEITSLETIRRGLRGDTVGKV